MKAFWRENKLFVCYMTNLALLLPAAMIAWALGSANVAFMIGGFGPILVILTWMGYAAIWDSRSRWPGLNAWQRLAQILTFQR